MIDPTVGSGHFLLGGFERLFAHWQKQEPMTEPAVLAERCLNSLFGVDLNPYAANIARFRLLVAALKACGIKRLREARDWTINIAVGDSLLHGSFAGGTAGGELFEAQVRTDTGNQYATSAEDLEVLRRFLMPRRYHVVVGNPPYITVKDAALSEAYRRRYGACHGKYALTVPFFERFFDLAVAPESAEVSKAGFVGKITGNSFMKQAFGKKLIEMYLPRWDLTHVIDTAGAYLPGHGTPTAILFGRHRAPVSKTIRAVLGIRGEPATPEDPATAKVWSAILSQIDRPESESEFVSVSDALRENYEKHPWSIGGGGAAELKETLDSNGTGVLGDLTSSVGPASFPGVDEPFVAPRRYFERHGFRMSEVRPFLTGKEIRHWGWLERDWCFAPYAADGAPFPFSPSEPWARALWLQRTVLKDVTSFGGETREQLGEAWWTWYRWIPARVSLNLKVAFPSQETHNHFAMIGNEERSNRHAPLLILSDSSEYTTLTGLLNSSAACFWTKQVYRNKGSTVDQHGARQRTIPFEDFWEYGGAKLEQFPVPWKAEGAENLLRAAVMAVAHDIDTLAQARAQFLPTSLLAAAASIQSALLQLARNAFQMTGNALQAARKMLQPARNGLQTTGSALQADGSVLQTSGNMLQLARGVLQVIRREADADHSRESARAGAPATPLTRADLDVAKQAAQSILQQMIALQEELDWMVYRAYGLLEDTKAEHAPAAEAPPINLGERAFEIVMARKMEAGTLNTEWFRRHGSTPITQIPAHWPAAYKKVVEHRIALIEAGPKQNKDIALIEQPEYKRRWNTEKWEEMEERALREWLLDRLEWGTKPPSAETTNGSRSSVWDEREPRLMTASRLADRMRGDEAFRSVATLYAKSHGGVDDLTATVSELVEAESVPFLPVLRYKETGLRNRAIWERTWELQREEDRLEALRERARTKMKAASEVALARLPQQEADEAKRSDVVLQRLLKKDAAWIAAKVELDAVPANPEIEVPPRYTGKDFQNATFWRLRGKLDVPKERFISFPHCGPDGDQSMLITWAGFDHCQQAKAITTYYTDKKANAGWDKSRFVPLLAGLAELVPWLRQWHNTPDADGHNWAEVIDGFIADEARELGLMAEQIKAWKPPQAMRRSGGAGRRKKPVKVEPTLQGTGEGNG